MTSSVPFHPLRRVDSHLERNRRQIVSRPQPSGRSEFAAFSPWTLLKQRLSRARRDLIRTATLHSTWIVRKRDPGQARPSKKPRDETGGSIRGPHQPVRHCHHRWPRSPLSAHRAASRRRASRVVERTTESPDRVRGFGPNRSQPRTRHAKAPSARLPSNASRFRRARHIRRFGRRIGRRATLSSKSRLSRAVGRHYAHAKVAVRLTRCRSTQYPTWTALSHTA
jgi:hypothetical protein